MKLANLKLIKIPRRPRRALLAYMEKHDVPDLRYMPDRLPYLTKFLEITDPDVWPAILEEPPIFEVQGEAVKVTTYGLLRVLSQENPDLDVWEDDIPPPDDRWDDERLLPLVKEAIQMQTGKSVDDVRDQILAAQDAEHAG